MENLLLSCIESRVENNRKFYGRFQLGPFDPGQGLTVANALRRTLLSELHGLGIFAVEIEGAKHEYSKLRGIQESVLDILLNFKKIVFTSQFQIQHPQFGYLYFQGPGIVTAKDLKLPVSIQSVDPDQYIATLSYNGSLKVKFIICEEKNTLSFTDRVSKFKYQFSEKKNQKIFDKKYLSKDSDISLFSLTSFSNLLPLDVVCMPIDKVNFLLENLTSRKSEKLKEKIILEVWTNGSIHPRQAIHEAAKILVQLFLPFQEIRVLKSVFFHSHQTAQSKKENEKKITTLDIGNLDLSLRPYTCLKRAKVHTIGDLLRVSRDELLLLKNFGKRSLEEVEKSLQQLGLRLKN
jgi:DNA-directed RNA polymerase subunit alpha